jgi:hypothetical protein
MSIRIRLLAAAGAIALPAALAAQTTNPEMQPPTSDPTSTVPQSPRTPPGSPDMPTPPSGQQPTDQSMAGGQAGASTPATAADLQAGATVYDTQGGTVGTIESADGSSAVLSTGTVRARLPISSFAKGPNGLVIAMTRAQLEAAARAQSPQGATGSTSRDEPQSPPENGTDTQSPSDDPR